MYRLEKLARVENTIKNLILCLLIWVDINILTHYIFLAPTRLDIFSIGYTMVLYAKFCVYLFSVMEEEVNISSDF